MPEVRRADRRGRPSRIISIPERLVSLLSRAYLCTVFIFSCLCDFFFFKAFHPETVVLYATDPDLYHSPSGRTNFLVGLVLNYLEMHKDACHSNICALEI